MTGDEQDQSQPDEHFYEQTKGFTDFSDILAELEDMLKSKKRKKKTKGEDLSVGVEVSFMEAVTGGKKKVSVNRKTVCGSCKGTKMKKDGVKNKCSYCRGNGIVIIDLGITSFQQVCGKCNGEGYKIKSKCATCKGTGQACAESHETITFPPGINSDYRLKFTHKGHFSPEGGVQGDLYVKFSITPHHLFKRSGCDVFSNVYITLPQAVLGGIVQIQTLDGTASLRIEPGTDSGESFRMTGLGIVNFPLSESERGDAIYTVCVQTPKKLNSRQKELYEELALESGLGEKVFERR